MLFSSLVICLSLQPVSESAHLVWFMNKSAIDQSIDWKGLFKNPLLLKFLMNVSSYEYFQWITENRMTSKDLEYSGLFV